MTIDEKPTLRPYTIRFQNAIVLYITNVKIVFLAFLHYPDAVVLVISTQSLLFVPICYFFVYCIRPPNPSRPILFTTGMFVMFVFQSDILLEITWTYGYTDTL
jgi:hypothetical protein